MSQMTKREMLEIIKDVSDDAVLFIQNSQFDECALTSVQIRQGGPTEGEDEDPGEIIFG